MNNNLVNKIAKIAHKLNKVYCESIGDYSQVEWKDAPEWQKESAKKGVEFHLYNELTRAKDSHESWLKEKKEKGWVFGEIKDPEKKTHPCIVPFEELPKEQQIKDYLFKGIVDIFKNEFELLETKGYTNGQKKAREIKGDKQLRVNLDIELSKFKMLPKTRERSLAITKLQESIMWLGMNLKRLNTENPYKESYNIDNTKINKTADGLTF